MYRFVVVVLVDYWCYGIYIDVFYVGNDVMECYDEFLVVDWV